MKKLTQKQRLMLAFCTGQLAARTSAVRACTGAWTLASGAEYPFIESIRRSLADEDAKPAAAFGTCDNLAHVMEIIWRIERILGMPHAGRTAALDKSLGGSRAEAVDAPWGTDDLSENACRLAREEFAAAGKSAT